MAKRENIILYLLVIVALAIGAYAALKPSTVVKDEVKDDSEKEAFGGASHTQSRFGTADVEFGYDAITIASASTTGSFTNSIKNIRGDETDIIIYDIMPLLDGNASSSLNLVWAWATSVGTTSVGSSLPEPAAGAGVTLPTTLVGLYGTPTSTTATTTSLAEYVRTLVQPSLGLPILLRYGNRLDFRLYHRSNISGAVFGDGQLNIGEGYSCFGLDTCRQASSTLAVRGFNPKFIIKYMLIGR